jgi:hypothetical protein
MRSIAVTAPLLMVGYGVLRWIDGLDGHHDKTGVPWRAGHAMFFVAMILFAILAVRLSRVTRPRAVAAGSAAAAVIGAGCFLWVIAGDLFPGFRAEMPLPGPLQTVGPLLFVLGLLTLLCLLVGSRRLPVWSPVLFLAGFVAISVDLDLLPVAALLVLGALIPLDRPGTPVGELSATRS